MLAEVFEEFLIGLVGQEPQRQFAERDQVVGAEEVREGLRDPFLRVDVAVEHPAAQLQWLADSTTSAASFATAAATFTPSSARSAPATPVCSVIWPASLCAGLFDGIAGGGRAAV